MSLNAVLETIFDLKVKLSPEIAIELLRSALTRYSRDLLDLTEHGSTDGSKGPL